MISTKKFSTTEQTLAGTACCSLRAVLSVDDNAYYSEKPLHKNMYSKSGKRMMFGRVFSLYAEDDPNM